MVDATPEPHEEVKPKPPLRPDDVERLRLFQRRMDDLRARRLVQRRGSTSLSVNYEFGPREQPGPAYEGYDEDDFRAFVSVFRQFLLEQEPVHFLSVAKLVTRRCPRIDLVVWAKEARRRWTFTMDHGHPCFSLHITEGGVQRLVTVKGAWDLLLYGELIHSDADKAKRLAGYHPGTRATHRFLVQWSIAPLVWSLGNLDSVIHIWLDAPSTPVPDLHDETARPSSSTVSTTLSMPSTDGGASE